MNKPFWDVDEIYNKYQGVYVLNLSKSNVKAFNQMKLLNELLNKLKICAKNELLNNNNLNSFQKNGIELFLNTEHKIIEMKTTDSLFNAINKPKYVHDTNNINHGTDKNLRALYRVILFRIRDSNNNIRFSDEKLKQLFVHEISHTFANHVKFRFDDHGEDFKIFERLVLDMFLKEKIMNKKEYF